MGKNISRLLAAGAIVMAAVSSLGASEARTAEVLAPWQGEGKVFMIEEKKAKFFGVFEGTMYVQTGHKDHIDALPFVCPTTQVIDLKNMTIVTNGNCVIGAENDIIFAAIECAGPSGGCEGTFSLKGGTGKFSGISGGSKMSARTKIKEFTFNIGSIVADKQAAGLIVLPKLTYKIPSK